MSTFKTTTTGTQKDLVADFLERAAYHREQAQDVHGLLPRYKREHQSGLAEGLELAASLLEQHTFTDEVAE